jgi:cation diffusion facilitator CzcD-associated flavoprotein CzcO
MTVEHQDVIIIGAGLSGIGAAYHLSQKCPNKSVTILEGRSRMGGTWDLFKYPGIRSDSDMYTLGYNFKPWNDPQAIADGPSILKYIKEAAKEHSLEEKIRFQHQVNSINWCSKNATWTVSLEVEGEPKTLTCNFLISCTGYYNYQQGYTPDFKGREDFKGDFIHPQLWDEKLDYKDKKIVVIGSGATAVTLVPELAKQAASVTMLQRSPTYVASVPKEDKLLPWLRKFLPNNWVYRFARTRNIAFTMAIYNYCRAFPNHARKALTKLAKKELGDEYDMKHFTPKYAPWDERLCAVPDGDLFDVLKKGKANILTDTIDHFTKDGLVLNSGDTLSADIVISATGLDLQLMGGLDIQIDGTPFNMSEAKVYRGVLIENLPNLGMIFGYTNASWTLKSDLTSEYICRVLNYMEKTDTQQCVPVDEENMDDIPFIDMSSGYIKRALDKVPKQGQKSPWRLHQNYLRDMAMLRLGSVNDGVIKFTKTSAQPEMVPLQS